MREKPHRSPAPGDRERFTTLWDSYAGQVFAYTCRHVDHHTAQEVVAETFLVAWRRLADVPDPGLPWLIVVARNTMSNNRRTVRRHDALTAEMARIEEMTSAMPATDVTVTDRAEVLEALATLTPAEREALLLTAWDGLSATEAARVAGCSVPAMHVRLFRARRRLHTGLSAEPAPSISLRATTRPRSAR